MRFLLGSQNFGLDLDESDRDYFEIYYPEVHNLCEEIKKIKEVSEGTGIIKRIDIRKLPDLFHKSNLDILQLLFSKEVIDGGELEEYFRINERDISRMNISRLYKSIMGSNMSRLKRRTTRDLAHVIFGFRLLIKFEENGFEDLRSCFRHDEREYYQKVRLSPYTEHEEYALELERLCLEKKELYESVGEDVEFFHKFKYDMGMMVVDNIKKGE